MKTLFLDYLAYEKRSSPHTVKAYATDLEQLAHYLLFQYETPLEAATFPMLRSWLATLLDEKCAPISINRKIASARAFYRFLRRKGLLDKDPTQKLRAVPTPKKLPQFVEEKAMERLFDEVTFADDWTGLRDRVLLELLYGTGMRLAELVGLEVEDLDLATRLLRVMGKRSKERLIPITPALAELLQTYLSVRAPEEPTSTLLLTDTGKAIYPVFVQRIVKKYLSEVTTLHQRSPHILRHTYATHLLNRGADLNAIKELLGHTSLAATQIYTHNAIEKLKKTHQQAHPKA